MFAELGGRIAALSVRLTALDRDMARLHTRSPVSQLLAEIPGGRPDQRAELRPHGGCLAVQVEASSRRLARPDTEAEVDGRQATAGRDLAPGRRTAAPVAGARRNRRGGHCRTRQPACQRLTAGPAAAPSAQATDRHLLLSPFHPRCQRFRRPSRDGMPHRWSYGPHDMGHLAGQRDRRERTDERDTPCHPTALCETADILRARSRNPSGPRSCGPHRKAGT